MEETTVACPACGQPNPGNKRFCGDCGTPLSQPAANSPPDKERRLVTVLFSDLVGSTVLGETLDPEEVDELVSGAQATLAGVVSQYGGHVAKLLGDGMMVLFGAPVAHKDDAERAVLAALRMHQALMEVNTQRHPGGSRQALGGTPEPPSGTPPLEMRIGITSGEVIASGKDGSYDVIGDAANTAARLQNAADIGGVLVGAETMHLAQRRIRFGERRELSLKGKAGTVAAYPVLGVREQVTERWEMPAGRTPLTGRDRELDFLLHAWRRSQAGEGQLIALVGDAGVGKSRLVRELVEKVTPDAPAQVLRGRCLSYGQEISLWLIADLLRAIFAIGEQDSLAERQTKVASTVASLLAGEVRETQAAAIDVLGEVLGFSAGTSIVGNADAQVRRQTMIHSLRMLLAALAKQAPKLLVLEDLHWIDAASAEVLSEIMVDVPMLPLLVLATQRPGSLPSSSAMCESGQAAIPTLWRSCSGPYRKPVVSCKTMGGCSSYRAWRIRCPPHSRKSYWLVWTGWRRRCETWHK